MQQEASARRESSQTIENQESKIATLSDRISEQRAEIRGLEQRVANLDSRCGEYKADVSTHSAAAETARATNAILEDRSKQKELELESTRAKLQALEAISVASTARVDDALQAKVLELEATIDLLKSKAINVQENAGTIEERYQGGKLVSSIEYFGRIIIVNVVSDS